MVCQTESEVPGAPAVLVPFSSRALTHMYRIFQNFLATQVWLSRVKLAVGEKALTNPALFNDDNE